MPTERTNVRTELDHQVRNRLKGRAHGADNWDVISAHSFAVLLVFGSVTLAFWLAARFPNAGPSTFRTAVLQMLCGAAAIRAVSGLGSAAMQLWPQGARLLVPFGIALPLLTYGFLTGLWVLRTIHRALSNVPR
jgi:hypothetical protein